MKEQLLFFTGSRVVHAGWRETEPFERDPDKVWLGESQWYLNPDGTITHAGEQLGTINPVDPSVLVYTKLITLGDKTPEGRIVKAATATWFGISRQLETNPNFRFEFCAQPAKLEEFLAGAHHIEGWPDVTLTPRSGDKGRDVIAETDTQRLLQQAKAYSPGCSVSQNDVRAIYGVLCLDDNATKALITTTADFSPGVAEEFAKVMPHRLETRNGEQLTNWISSVTASPSVASNAATSIARSVQVAGFRVAIRRCDRCGGVTISNGNFHICPDCGNTMQFKWLAFNEE